MTAKTYGSRQSLFYFTAIICAVFFVGTCLFSATVLSAELSSNESVVKAVERAAERIEKAVDRVEKAVDRSAERAETAEHKAKRPAEEEGPTKVYFFIFLIDVDSIDDAEQNFTANFFIRLRWKDERLAKPESSSNRLIPLDQVWSPRVITANRTGLLVKSLPDVVEVRPDGTVMYQQRLNGKLSQPLNLSEFPLDQHTFTVQMVATGVTEGEMEFIPDTVRGILGGAIADELSLPDWKLVKQEALALSYEPVKLIRNPGFAFQFDAKRYVSYYIWQMVLPLSIVVIMSWVAFWIGREHIGVRIGVATSSILTVIAHRFVLANRLPRLPYMTHLDYFTAGSTLLVFLSLIVVATTRFLSDKNDDRSRIVDNWARVGFPLTFLVLLGWFLLL